MTVTASPQQQQQQMRGGLTFLKTLHREEVVDVYVTKIGMKVWLEQPNITILNFGNLILGWHQIDSDKDTGDGKGILPDVTGMYTFVYPSTEEVDNIYHVLSESTSSRSTTAIVDGPPRVNDRYQIYQFFAKDPEGRNLEFQAFLHPVTIVTSQVSDTIIT
jgi:hypothetical protein